MLALIRLLHCLNSVNEIPDHHSMYANLLSWSSMTLTSDEFQQNLKNSIAGIQEIYGNVEDNVDDRGFVKYCFSEILQSLWSSPGTDTEKGKMHNTCSLKIFFGSYSIYGRRIHGHDKDQINCTLVFCSCFFSLSLCCFCWLTFFGHRNRICQ